MISGFVLCASSLLIYKFYKFDPIDANLLINEQAINLTTQFTDNFREYVTLDDFMQEVKVSNKDRSSKKLKDNNISVGEYETRILKRWKTLSFLQTLRLNGIVRMMFISCLIFFKYRIVNKMVVIVTKKDENRLGLFVRISFISLYIGLFLVGERNSFNSVRFSNFQILKRPSIQPLGIFASRLIWFRDHLITYFCV